MRAKILALTILLAAVGPALAAPGGPHRWFVDLFVGAAWLGTTEVEVRAFNYYPTPRFEEERVSFGRSTIFGIRNGIWGHARSGLGAWWEFSYFPAEGGTTSIDVFTLTALVGWGWKLGVPSLRAPGWTIYLAGGWGLTAVDIDTSAGGLDADGLSTEDSPELRLGMMWYARRRHAGFLELRYLNGEVVVDRTSFFGGSTIEEISMDLDAWQLVAGWSIRVGAGDP